MRYFDFRLTLVPALLILIVPIVIFTPILHKQLVDGGNSSAGLFSALFPNVSGRGTLRCDYSE